MPPHVVRAWMLVIIIAREFIVTGLRQLALQQHTVMAAETIGKHKTAWQMIGIFAVLTYYAIGDLEPVLPPAVLRLNAHGPAYLLALFYVVTFFTLVSGVIYLWRYRSLYIQHT
jgi:CDP-diacylglycerol--glycerol-3-phosphate 3-phosphatidyltransferase